MQTQLLNTTTEVRKYRLEKCEPGEGSYTSKEYFIDPFTMVKLKTEARYADHNGIACLEQKITVEFFKVLS
jgi:hypothetical protein